MIWVKTFEGLPNCSVLSDTTRAMLRFAQHAPACEYTIKNMNQMETRKKF